MLRFSLVILLLLLPSATSAQDSDWVKPALRENARWQCEWLGNCYQHYRYKRWRERQAQVRAWERRHDDDDEDRRYHAHSTDPWRWDDHTRRLLARGEYGEAMRRAERGGASYARNNKCHDRIIEVTTMPMKSERRAIREAWKLWVRSVNLERGAIWQDPNNSVQRWSLCVAVDIDDTYLGKVSRGAGKVFDAYQGAKALVQGKEKDPSDDNEDGRNMSCRLWARACPDLPVPAITESERKVQAKEAAAERRERKQERREEQRSRR